MTSAGVMVNNIKKHLNVIPYGNQGSYSPENVIDFYFPSTGYLDIHSLTLIYNITFSNAGSVAWPRDAESVIHRLEVYVNGNCVNFIDNYNQVYRTIKDYARSSSEHLERSYIKNGLTNGNCVAATASTWTYPFIAQDWLGLFGEQGIIDMSKNQIHIRITIAPRFIIVSPSNTDTFTLSNPYLTLDYYEAYTGTLLSQIPYSDYKCVIQSNPSFSQETNIKILSKNIDYIIGTFLTSGYRTVSNATNNISLNSLYFAKTTTPSNISTWNFKVNGRRLFNYSPTWYETYNTMKYLFPEGTFLYGYTTQQGTGFTVGAKVNFVNEEPEEVELSFETLAGSTNTNNFSLVFVKLNNSLNIN